MSCTLINVEEIYIQPYLFHPVLIFLCLKRLINRNRQCIRHASPFNQSLSMHPFFSANQIISPKCHTLCVSQSEFVLFYADQWNTGGGTFMYVKYLLSIKLNIYEQKDATCCAKRLIIREV